MLKFDVMQTISVGDHLRRVEDVKRSLGIVGV
jgi:hypothetical protein